MQEDSKRTWNYRVIKHTHMSKLTNESEDYYQIHEVYYTDDIPVSVTKDPISVGGDTVEEIKWTLEKMRLSLEKDVISMEYFENLANKN